MVSIYQNLETWQHQLLTGDPLLHEAYILLRLTTEDKTNAQGQHLLSQGLMMAEAVSNLKFGTPTIIAALLYPACQYAELSLEDLEERFGGAITSLIKSALKMQNMNVLRQKNTAHQIDHIRKMFLAIVQDVRVVVIKLAEEIAMVRHIHELSPQKQLQLAEECLHIYAPLASRLGLTEFKWQLEDAAFSIIDYEAYHTIAKALNETRRHRDQRLADILNTLTLALQAANIEAEITGRSKHIYSLYKKMQRKHTDISGIFDATALRILVKSKLECYQALSLIHELWQPISSEFDDYIATPKPNGYQSIHTALKDSQGKTFEVQIRTLEMHEASEMGVAAHWMYKEGKKASGYEEKIKWLRQLLEWQKELSTETTLPQTLEDNIFEDRVYVFSPEGDIIDLTEGSTPLDFAYAVHTELGHRCRGAKVNQKMVPLTYVLQMGDTVEILTASKSQPSRDWIIPQKKYLHSARARAKVLHWFKKLDFEEHILQGRQLLDRELKRLGFDTVDFTELATKFNFNEEKSLFAALGAGDLRLQQILHHLHNIQHQKPPGSMLELSSPQVSSSKADVLIAGVDHLLTTIAQCCKPIPGDPIEGYITRGHGISIHHADCKNLVDLRLHHQERLIPISWLAKTSQIYAVTLAIEASEREHLVSDITQLLAAQKCPVTDIHSKVDKFNHLRIQVTLELRSMETLTDILDRLHHLPGILAVARRP